MRLRFIKIVLMCLAISHLYSEDFISKVEYAKMLYANPRGIGCNKCHGENAEGSVISSYTHKGKPMALEAPNLTKVSKDRFLQALGTTHKVMPTYFLTDQELEILYYYVSNVADLSKNSKKSTKAPVKAKK